MHAGPRTRFLTETTGPLRIAADIRKSRAKQIQVGMKNHALSRDNGGETGIRTLGGLAPTTVFETAPFDHSGTSPQAHGP